jgi:predicted regulator of Ras-like GTPase activity (Roadblock/LC7/MglB family)
MSLPDMVLYEEDHGRIISILERLRQEANARVVFLLDKSGQQMGCAGDLGGLDPTSLASLTAGNVAATDGLAKLIGEREFSILFHEGERDNLHINVVARRAILVVLFDERSSLGLVRLRVRRASTDLTVVLDAIVHRAGTAREGEDLSPFEELTDEDIDALFG